MIAITWKYINSLICLNLGLEVEYLVYLEFQLHQVTQLQVVTKTLQEVIRTSINFPLYNSTFNNQLTDYHLVRIDANNHLQRQTTK